MKFLKLSVFVRCMIRFDLGKSLKCCKGWIEIRGEWSILIFEESFEVRSSNIEEHISDCEFLEKVSSFLQECLKLLEFWDDFFVERVSLFLSSFLGCTKDTWDEISADKPDITDLELLSTFTIKACLVCHIDKVIRHILAFSDLEISVDNKWEIWVVQPKVELILTKPRSSCFHGVEFFFIRSRCQFEDVSCWLSNSRSCPITEDQLFLDQIVAHSGGRLTAHIGRTN